MNWGRRYEKEKKSIIDKTMRLIAKCEKRKAWNEMFYFRDFSCPLTQHYTLNGFKDAFENVRLAPSAINKQPWRIVKHGNEFGYSTKEEYLKGANEVINSQYSLHKLEAEDNDEIYYDEDKNEIVFVSSDGYIRTYFKPSEGINYYNRQ